MRINKKKFSIIFILITYFIIGSYTSVNNGISFDEKHEQLNWNFHSKLINDYYNYLFLNDKITEEIKNEYKPFVGYGVGFQLISQPIQSFLKNILNHNRNIDNYGALLISKHFVVFLFFFVSGIFFFLILRKIIDNENFALLATSIYLTYPYLFGQSMFSPKDVPFMAVWLTCTYVICDIFDKLISKKKLSFKNVLALSLITSYLLSIRIAGLLIFVQYVIFLVLFASISKNNILKILKENWANTVLFTTSLTFFFFLFYPPFWIDPSLVIDSIRIMANHFNNVGTTTFGKIMYAKNLPSTYLLIWLVVKLPLIILIGLFLIPFCEKKIFTNDRKSILFGSILLSVIIIPLILIIRNTHLYDELRQVMFIIPLIFIIGLIAIYTFSKKFFYVIGSLTIIIFVIENIKINPYQYVWFNLPSRIVDLHNKFELEYQGLSGREIAKHMRTLENQSLCVLANPIHGVKHFLDNTNYKCFDIWQKVDTDYKRPFYAVQNVRNLKKSMPYKCKSIFETKFKLLFYKKSFVTGKLLRCD